MFIFVKTFFIMDVQLISEIQSLPVYMQTEVKDFVGFLKTKLSNKKTFITKKREFGKYSGKIKMTNDFDDPLDDFKEDM
jgi:hypothetical protein